MQFNHLHMMFIDFLLSDRSIVTKIMERNQTIKDVKREINSELGRDVGDLFLNGEKLDDDKTYNEIVMLTICASIRTVCLTLDTISCELQRVKDTVENMRSVAVSTMIQEVPSDEDEHNVLVTRAPSRSRSPRNRVG